VSQRTVGIEEARKLAKGKRATRRAAERAAIDARRDRYRVSSEPIRVKLPLPPLLNHYYEFTVVNKHISKKLSHAGTVFRAEIIHLWQHVGVTFKGRLAIRVNVTFPDKMKRDLDGYWKALLDALEHAGAYENDSQIKLAIIEQEHVSKPGWIDVVLGPKPGERQGTLFETEF
jgi:crossover junction endodeoxyribonuclease RusA